MSSVSYLPIRELHPGRSSFVIKARVTNRTSLEQKVSQKGANFHLFSCDIVDKDDYEIRITFFNENAKNYDAVIQKGVVFEFHFVGGGRVKIANARYNTVNCRYELTFNDQDRVVPLADDDEIEHEVFNYKTLRQIRQRTEGDCVTDLAVIVKECETERTISTKAGHDTVVRKLTVFDDGEQEMELSLWDTLATNGNYPRGTLLSLKAISIRDFQGGRTASAGRQTTIEVISNGASHKSERIQTLAKWWAKVLTETGGDVSFSSISEMQRTGNGRTSIRAAIARKTLAEIIATTNQGEASSYGQNGEEFEIFARLTRLVANGRRNSANGALEPSQADEFNNGSAQSDFLANSNICYPSCPTCKKKVTVTDGHSQTRCEKCAKMVTILPRFMFRMLINDSTSTEFATCFHESGLKIFGSISASQAVQAEGKKEIQKLFDPMVQSNIYKLRVRAKKEDFDVQGQQKSRIRMDVGAADRLTDAQYGITLLKQLQESVAEVREVIGGDFGSLRRKILADNCDQYEAESGIKLVKDEPIPA